MGFFSGLTQSVFVLVVALLSLHLTNSFSCLFTSHLTILSGSIFILRVGLEGWRGYRRQGHAASKWQHLAIKLSGSGCAAYVYGLAKWGLMFIAVSDQ